MHLELLKGWNSSPYSQTKHWLSLIQYRNHSLAEEKVLIFFFRILCISLHQEIFWIALSPIYSALHCSLNSRCSQKRLEFSPLYSLLKEVGGINQLISAEPSTDSRCNKKNNQLGVIFFSWKTTHTGCRYR